MGAKLSSQLSTYPQLSHTSLQWRSTRPSRSQSGQRGPVPLILRSPTLIPSAPSEAIHAPRVPIACSPRYYIFAERRTSITGGTDPLAGSSDRLAETSLMQLPHG